MLNRPALAANIAISLTDKVYAGVDAAFRDFLTGSGTTGYTAALSTRPQRKGATVQRLTERPVLRASQVLRLIRILPLYSLDLSPVVVKACLKLVSQVGIGGVAETLPIAVEMCAQGLGEVIRVDDEAARVRLVADVTRPNRTEPDVCRGHACVIQATPRASVEVGQNGVANVRGYLSDWREDQLHTLLEVIFGLAVLDEAIVILGNGLEVAEDDVENGEPRVLYVAGFLRNAKLPSICAVEKDGNLVVQSKGLRKVGVFVFR